MHEQCRHDDFVFATLGIVGYAVGPYTLEVRRKEVEVKGKRQVVH